MTNPDEMTAYQKMGYIEEYINDTSKHEKADILLIIASLYDDFDNISAIFYAPTMFSCPRPNSPKPTV